VGVTAVWQYVADNAPALYSDVACPPVELSMAELQRRTQAVRVAMSRRVDGVAIVRISFARRALVVRRSVLREDYGAVISQTTVDTPSQVNVWIGRADKACKLDADERRHNHPLVYQDVQS
jgi:hypothetical protein